MSGPSTTYLKGKNEAQEKKSREDEAAHAQNVRVADAYWKKKAQEKDWECVAPDLSVYKYSGVKLKEDPRRSLEYRKKVVDGLGFGQDCIAKSDSLQGSAKSR